MTQSLRARLLTLAMLVTACCVALTRTTNAQNRGVYPLGMSATNSGVTPEPGFTYVNQLLIYSRDESKDPDGEVLGTGSNSVVMDMNTLAWVSKKKILGAKFSMTASIQPGDTLDLDYSVMHSVSLGSEGYNARQTTDKTGPTIMPEQSKAHYKVNALGVGSNLSLSAKSNVGFKYFQEFSNRSTFQGHSIQFSGSIKF